MKRRMKRSPLTRRAVLGSLFILCYGAAVFTAAAQEIRFRFDPPDDFAYISTATHKHTQHLIENSVDVGKRTRTSEGRAKITVEKKPDGYSVTFAPFSFRMTQNGEPVDNPVIEFLQTIALTYELDADGNLVELAGVEGLFEEFMASLPAELPPGVAEMLDEDAFRKRIADEWDGRIGMFVGEDVQIGEIWTDIFDMTDAYGEPLPLYAATKFAEQVKFDGVDCARIQFYTTTDADELKEFMGERWEDLAGKVEAEDPPDASDSKRIITSKFVREGERIIDPTIMLVYSETRRETSTTTYDYPEHGLLEIIETEEYEYGYEKIEP